jgi:signal transduction histidine kinase
MKSRDKIFKNAIIKLTIGICILFPLINVGYFIGLYGVTTVFQNSFVTKVFCSIEGPYAFSDTSLSVIGISDNCAINDFWRTLIVLGSLLILLVIVTWWYVKRALLPIRFAHNAQRQFSSSALHQMQTPLSIMRSQIDNAKLSSSNIDNNVLDSLINELKVLEDTTKSLVQLTKPILPVAIDMAQVRKVLKVLSKAHKINVYHSSKKTKSVPLMYEDLYMILDIAFGNIVKHTNTKVAYVDIYRKMRRIVIDIRDEGGGFKRRNKKEMQMLQHSGHGIGLNIVTIITQKYGGTLNIVKKSGTRLIISLPSK